MCALGAALALTAVACGGGSPLSHDDYQQKLNTLGRQANQQAAIVVGSVFGAKGDLTKIADQMDQAGDAIGGYADDLDGLTPPDDAADANAKLVEGFRAAETAFHQMAGAARANDKAKLDTLTKQLTNGDFAKELQQAGAELTKAGYTFPNSQ
jgi:hypothetical protein